MAEVGVFAHIGRIVAAQFQADADEAAGAACSMARPPATDPVKQTTLT